ncbi:LamG-like jellyroll fold domain-containing protein [Catellatospora sp. NPDC049609]|uniref:LamG-like jellyroll fold domain-containing protein n=1 Tax=Catellatospora sp. NPDC049609 TaxID=3155505 RepID=UPI0034323A0E
MLLNLAMPAGAVPPGGDFPLSWLWSWIPRVAWADSSVPRVPADHGSAGHGARVVPTDETDANGLSDGPARKKVPFKPVRVVGRQGVFDERTSKRLAAGSDQKSHLYENVDGSFTRKLFSDPVNYRDADGVWKPIDRSLVQGAGGRFRQKATDTDVTLAATADDRQLVTVRADRKHALSYALAGAAKSAGVAAQNAVTYPEVLPGVDFKVEVTASGAKDSLILKSAAQAPESFLFHLDMQGLSASIDPNGSVVLRDAGGKSRITIPAGFMQDANFDRETGDFTRSDAVTYELVTVDGKQALRVTPDAAWLRDPSRVYPVVLDPSSFNTTGDTYVYNTDDSDHSPENNLPVGTFDSGTHVARSLLHFSGFSSSYSGATLSQASLALFLTWTYDCTPRKFHVKMINGTWDAETVQWPGPSLGSSIGSLTPDPKMACYNDTGNRSNGVWVNVPLSHTSLQAWLTGTANNGLALTADSETTSNQWKRFTSRNYDNYKKAPFLLLTYTGPGTPQVDGAYPPSGYVTPTLTPVLIAEAHDPDRSGGLTYNFAVYEGSTLVAQSGYTAATSWTVPAAKLVRGKDYSWTVTVNDGTSVSPPKWYALSTQPRQPLMTSVLSQNGGRGFEASAGNYTASATDVKVPTVGPPLTITRSYNSQDPRGSHAFGTGWSSMLDAKVVELDRDGTGLPQAMSVTYPTGQESVFARNPDGTFVPPQGRSGVLKCVDGAQVVMACPTTAAGMATMAGYRLLEKDGNSYTFLWPTVTGTYLITEMADLAQRKLLFWYSPEHELYQIHATGSDRKLHLEWTGGRVTKISTDPADDWDSASEWNYEYSEDGDLEKVCLPQTQSTPECISYDYTTSTLYPAVTRNLAPTSNWRLTETTGTTAANSVLDHGGVADGAYVDVALGQAGPLAGSTATAAGFNGTSSTVTLPATLANESGYRSVSVWFKTTERGKVVLSQSAKPLADGPTNWGYTPLLYVNSSGKLSGQFPTAPTTGLVGTLLGGGSGLCVGPAGGSMADGALVQLVACTGADSQKWSLDSSSRLTVTSGSTTKCLTVVGAGTANGVDVQLNACSTGTNQKWTMMPDGRVIGTGSSRCLEATGAAVGAGTQLQIYNCASPIGGHQAWFGSVHTPIASNASAPVVDDGAWHHAVLAAAGNTQTLYVDGVNAGTKSGLVVGGRQMHQNIGAGFLGIGWPGQSVGTTGTNKGTPVFFNGSIAEVAYFDKPLRIEDVNALRTARAAASRPLDEIRLPSGKVVAHVDYNTADGVVSQVTDENGGTWGISAPTVEGSYEVYSSAVMGAGPTDYWRLADLGDVDALNEVNGGIASYGTGVVLAEAPGPFGESTRAARFDGTSAHVVLPAAPQAGPYSISMWFRVPAGSAGGTLFGYQDQPLGTAPAQRTPALYIGTDGRLRGRLGASGTPIATALAVEKDKWHHVALAGGTNAQAMYLDGQLVGTLSGAIAPNGTYAYLGAGSAQGWPFGRNDITGYFAGDIAEVALYRRQLAPEQVDAQFKAMNKAQGRGLVKKYTITDPSTEQPREPERMTVSYGLPSGMKVAETNALGQETIYGADASGRLQIVVDANGNYTEAVRDSRGNVVEQISCTDRSAVPAKCSSVHYAYQVNAANDMDPCNDKVIQTRDGRSTSRTDNTYRTVYTYDSRCNQVSTTDPLGRKTTTEFSDGNSLGPDGGITPPDLPIKVVTPSGATQHIAYYHTGDVASVTDPAGMTTRYEYDNLGRVVKKTTELDSGLSQVVTMEYDKQSRLRYQTYSPITNQVTGAVHQARSVTEYDLDGNIVRQAVEDLLGGDATRATVNEYDAHNRKWRVTDPAGNVAEISYDTFGNVVREKQADGVIVESTYHLSGLLYQTKIKNWVGDPNNPNPTPADFIVASRNYDEGGRLATVTDAKQWQTRYEYYDNNQISRIVRSDGAAQNPRVYVVEENKYDGAGNLIERISDNGETKTAFDVDAASRTYRTVLDPDGLKRITETSFDADNRPYASTAKNAAGAVLAYGETAYDPLNRVLSQTTYNGTLGTATGRIATGHWRLDAATGGLTADDAGNNPGTASSGVTFIPAGEYTVGEAEFDGTGTITGRTSTVDTSRSFTIATVVKLDASVDSPVMIASQDGTDVSGFTLGFNRATGLWQFSMPRDGRPGAPVESVSSNQDALHTLWVHVAAVYDAATSKMKIYVDGVKVGETNRTAKPWHAPGRFIIGGGKAGREMNNMADLVGRDSSGALQVYPNNGSWPSMALGTAKQLGTGFTAMNWIDAADVTGDGKPDILARETATGILWLYPNTSSGSTVSLGTRRSLGNGWGAMTWLGLGDYDSDGRKDLFTRDSAGLLWVRRHTGHSAPGGFGGFGTQIQVGSGWNIMNWIGIGDLNSDGRDDLIGRKTSEGYLYYYLHTGGTGTSTYGIATHSGSGWGSYDLSLGDLNGDGRIDIAGRNSSDQLFIYPNTGGTGTTMFGARSQLGTTTWANIPLYFTANIDGDPSGRFLGQIADVQVYQSALSDADIATLDSSAYGTELTTGGSISRVSYTVTRGGLVTSKIDPLGNVTDYAYDEAGRAVRTTSPQITSEVYGSSAVQARAITEVGYDNFGGAQDTRDAHGRITTTEFDALGRVTATIMPDYTPPGSSAVYDGKTSRTYDAAGRTKTETDANGKTTTYHYDQLGRVSKVVNHLNHTTTFAYDELGKQISTTDPTGATVTATHGFLGRICSTTQHVTTPAPAQYTTTYRYNVDEDTCQDAPDYGDSGRQTKTITPGNVSTRSVYNKVGEVTRTYDAANKYTDFQYDALGRQVVVKQFDNSRTEAVYDLGGRMTKVREFDAAGVEQPTGSTRYDRAGQVLGVTDARQHETTFTYDATGLLVEQRQPLSATDSITSTFGYDLTGRRTRFTDGRGIAYWTTYNSWGLPESTIEPATTAHSAESQRTFTTVYDKAGRPARQLSPGGVSIDYTYDDLGNLTEQSGTAPDATTVDKTFTYDQLGRMRSFSGPGGDTDLTYDERGLLLTIRGPSGDNDFAWNADGQMTSRTDAAGTTSFTYDTAGRLDTATNTAANLSLNYDYNDLSAVSRITYGGGNYRTYTYDNRHRIDVDELKTATNTSVAKIDYDFDANGNIVGKGTFGFGANAANVYAYDWADRLTSWTTTSGTTQYGYDKSGNRVQAGTRTFTYDQRNRLLTSGSTTYAYTPRGTMATVTEGTVATQTVSDAFNQVVSQGSGVGAQTYQYDALGRAVRPGHSYSGLDNDLAADDPTPANGTVDRVSYVRGPGGSLLGVQSGTTGRYAWTDKHTDVVAQFDGDDTSLPNIAVYDPLGKPLVTSTLVGRLGYQSEWTDSNTGRVNMAARWYNTDTGQFDSRDTVSLSPDGNSGNANRYAYGNANPLIATDPTGHWPMFDETSDPTLVKKYAKQNNKAKNDYYKSENKKKIARARLIEQYFKYELKSCNKVANGSKIYAQMGCDAQARPTCPPSNHYQSVLEWCTKVVITNDQCIINGQPIKKTDLQSIGAECMDIARRMDQTGGKYVGYETGEKTDVITAGEFGEIINQAATEGAEREKKRKEAECEADFWCSISGIVETVVSVAVGVAVYAGCMAVATGGAAVTAGTSAVAGLVGCGAIAGAAGGFIGSLAGSVAEGGWQALGQGETWNAAGVAGLTGLIGGAAGGALGGLAGGAIGKAGGSLFNRILGGAAKGAVAGATEGAVSGAASWGVNCMFADGDCSMNALNNSVMNGAMSGAIAGGIGGGAFGGLSGSPKACHSFDPSTKVLTAGGAAVAISSVKVGDKVVATDPETGDTTSQLVTAVHVNQDIDLTDVTVSNVAAGGVSKTEQSGTGKGGRSTRGPTESTLHTTWHHPFWDTSSDSWVDAAELIPGKSTLVGPDGEVHYVRAVRNYVAVKEMRDLTVAHIHTYYVLAGTAPVLVHNCNGGLDKKGNACECPSPKPINWARNSRPTWGHLWDDHGAKLTDARMADRAVNKNGQQGRWDDDEVAAAFLKSQYDPNAGVREVPLPAGVTGTVFLPGRGTVPATHARLIPGRNGPYKTGFPIVLGDE